MNLGCDFRVDLGHERLRYRLAVLRSQFTVGLGEGEPLIGDGVTAGIVRIGDTVRRPLRPFSLTVQAYLAHLRDAGFAAAPQPFGVDEQGREVLSFVPGDVARWLPVVKTAGDDVLVALARLVRALHEASAGWVPPPDAVWGGTPANPGRIAFGPTELVSHRDYAPGNVIFRDGRPAALIDFDLARPTTRTYDIANALSRVSAELDPVYRKLWENGAKVYLPRAEVWVREMAPAITARLTQST